MNQVTRIHPDRPDPLIDVEAEQQLLGSLLLEPSRVDLIGPECQPEAFADPLHAAIFERLRLHWKQGRPSGPSGLKAWAESEEGFQHVGGPQYLVRLAANAITPSMYSEYWGIIRPLAEKRALRDAIQKAQDDLADVDSTAGDIAGRLEAALMQRDGLRGAKPVSITKAVTEAMEKVRAAQSGESTGRIPTGIGALDSLIGGFNPGELIILAGRPSMGKSAVALSIASRVASRGEGVCFASLEMMPSGLAERLISERTAAYGAATNYTSFQDGNLSRQKLNAIGGAAREVAEMPIQILPMTYRDIAAINSGSKHSRTLLGETVGLRLVIVDYLQIMSSGKGSRYEQITEISSGLKAMAAQLEAPVLALSQLSRACEQREDKRPMLSDLRESGQIEQDADTVIFCYRDEYYIEREKQAAFDAGRGDDWEDSMRRARNRLELIVGKQRQGPIGTANVFANLALNSIWEADR